MTGPRSVRSLSASRSPCDLASGCKFVTDTIESAVKAVIAVLADEISARVIAHLRDQGTAAPGEASNSAAPAYLDEISTSKRYAISRRTLQHWRACGRGPAYRKAGRRVLYRVTEVEQFLAKRDGR